MTKYANSVTDIKLTQAIKHFPSQRESIGHIWNTGHPRHLDLQYNDLFYSHHCYCCAFVVFAPTSAMEEESWRAGGKHVGWWRDDDKGEGWIRWRDLDRRHWSSSTTSAHRSGFSNSVWFVGLVFVITLLVSSPAGVSPQLYIICIFTTLINFFLCGCVWIWIWVWVWVCPLAIPVLTYMPVNVNTGMAYFGQLPSLCSIRRAFVVLSERLPCNVSDGRGIRMARSVQSRIGKLLHVCGCN